jgi:hypothetical protein
MSSRALARRLERLEAELMPSDEGVLTIDVSFVSKPERNETIVLRSLEPNRRRRWPRNRWR